MFFRISRQTNARIVLIAPIAHFFCSQYDNTMAADKDPQDKAKKKRGRNWTLRKDDMLCGYCEGQCHDDCYTKESDGFKSCDICVRKRNNLTI